MQADAPLLHEDVYHRTTCRPSIGDQADATFRSICMFEEGRRATRLCRRRRGDRARVQDGQRPSGLHRAARLDGPVEPRRPHHDLDFDAGCLHRPPADGRAAADSRLASEGRALRNRRRLRRQDTGLSGAGGRHPQPQVRPAGEDDDEPGRRVRRAPAPRPARSCASSWEPRKTAALSPARPGWPTTPARIPAA